ncbi:MAG TPA: M15 family metallopeptidase, partial [Chitinophagaceae bacterium]|nr:M15 family metallopeptidase [Chitinophagaceae bacterium]
TAHHAFPELPVTVRSNRKLLKETMERYGFRALETEWWHYSWPNDRQYAVLDLSFRALRKKRY